MLSTRSSSAGPGCRPRAVLGWCLAIVLACSACLEQRATIVDDSAGDASQTISYQGVRVTIPDSWERLDLDSCEFDFEAWGPPSQDPCQAEVGVAFYASATFDPATGPGAHRVTDGRGDDPDWAGYVDAGFEWSVYVQDDSEDVVRSALVSVTSEGGEQGSASSVAIATSDWKPGDAGMRALVTGELRLSRTDCLHIGSGPDATDVVWPAGYTAERISTGTVIVKRPDGAVVAEVGRTFSAAGGYIPATSIEMPCRAGQGDVANINEDTAPLE